MLHAAKLFCEYQNDATTKSQNKTVLKDALFEELYEEIGRILPSLAYCLAPKKEYEKKKGSSTLRASGIEVSPEVVTGKEEQGLDRHAGVVYEWLNKTKVSRIRMLMHWQSAAGLSYVAAVHHRGAQCFRSHGEVKHEDNDPSVSLTSFQAAIKMRHRLGSSGIQEHSTATSAADDFGLAG